MLDRDYQNFYNEISKIIDKERIYTDRFHLEAYGVDASFYKLTPKIFIKAKSELEISNILKEAYKLELPVTFKSAGTSLSGQAVSDSILVSCAYEGFKKFWIEKEGKLITLEPAIIGAVANTLLKKYDRKIGPDPASINSAMIGGIASNNASGMCCGVEKNSYHSLEDIRVVLADGTILDTSSEESKEAFRESHSDTIQALECLARETKNNPELKAKIEKKYKIKNTMGYSLNALIDFDDIFDILAHLFIGSEGTLGFISKITYKTVKEPKFKADSLILFKDIYSASLAVAKIKKADIADAVELIDGAGLKSAQSSYSGLDNILKETTALLIQIASDNRDSLDKKIEKIVGELEEFKVIKPISFTQDSQESAKLWKIRKGLFPSVGAVREKSTTVIIEDVAFEIDKLADGIVKLQSLFEKYNYGEAVIFGHALEGNIHFVFTQNFSDEAEVIRYDNFMSEIATMVTDFEGSLKAEHGTGRNMAPFVELEWGSEAYTAMKKIKNIFDKKAILNPSVIINDDDKSHIKDLKPMPSVDDLIDKCIECGFCEVNCPSKNLTITPRQRIATNRAIEQALLNKKIELAKELKESYGYDGEETCATDGLCSLACPVEIDTGKYTKKLRAEKNSDFSKKMAKSLSKNFSTLQSTTKFSLTALNLTTKVISKEWLKNSTKKLNRKSNHKTPVILKSIPKASKRLDLEQNIESNTKVVYFPSCINRSFSSSDKELFEVIKSLLTKANIEIIYPQNIQSLCCGMPFSSKGFDETSKEKLQELEISLINASENGKYPILCDTSPCTYKMVSEMKNQKLNIFEPIEFANRFLLDRLNIKKTEAKIAIHTTCSSRKMNLESSFEKLANTLSENVIIPENIKCCGFAGDRGFFYPELNSSALEGLKEQVSEAKSCYSTSKTCELGLSENTNREYKSILYLLDSCSS